MVHNLVAILRDDRAVTTVEYGLIIALIVIVMASALDSVASRTQSMWTNVSNAVSAS